MPLVSPSGIIAGLLPCEPGCWCEFWELCFIFQCFIHPDLPSPTLCKVFMPFVSVRYMSLVPVCSFVPSLVTSLSSVWLCQSRHSFASFIYYFREMFLCSFDWFYSLSFFVSNFVISFLFFLGLDWPLLVVKVLGD